MRSDKKSTPSVEAIAKHTPGPWTVAQDDPFKITSEALGGVAFVYNEPAEVPGVIERAEANARLIAKAPELLEALRQIQAMAESRKSVIRMPDGRQLGNFIGALLAEIEQATPAKGGGK